MSDKPYLLKKWLHNGRHHRLLRTSGYRNMYAIERDDKDSLGEPHWNELYRWTDGHGTAPCDSVLTAVVTLIEGLQSELARAQKASSVENTASGAV